VGLLFILLLKWFLKYQGKPNEEGGRLTYMLSSPGPNVLYEPIVLCGYHSRLLDSWLSEPVDLCEEHDKNIGKRRQLESRHGQTNLDALDLNDGKPEGLP